MGTYPQPSDDVNPFGAATYAANTAAHEITNLDQLKEMQLRLLAAQPARIDKRGSLPCQPKLPSNLLGNPNVSSSLAQAPMLSAQSSSIHGLAAHPNRKSRQFATNGVSDSNELLTLTQSGMATGGGKKEAKDLANIKTFIKKQVIKFYQNNLVHEQNSIQRSKGIECKGQTIGGLMLTKPLGTTL